jgi:hypothetical protein
MDDLLFGEDPTMEEESMSDWVSIDFSTEEEAPIEEPTEEEVKIDELMEEATKEEPVKEEPAKEEPAKEEEPIVEEEKKTEEEFDLEALFEWLDTEIDESNKALDKLEKAGDWDVWEIWLVRDSLKRMEDQVKKLNNLNVDLKFKNAELEAFGINDESPELLIVSRNLSKAMNWDDKSKNKVVTTLKEMLYNLTWEDFDETKIDKDIDLLTASEAYNTEVNPNLKAAKDEDDYWIAL